ncbi:MAG: Lrp/AsnC family transcriptional regulator [Candidatus Micrarchaeia archaeon]
MAENKGLDLLDRKIMHELDLDARSSASQIARRLKKSKETVNFRINRLISEGFIKAFYSIFNTSLLGWTYYKLYVKFKDMSPAKEREFFEYVSHQPHVAYLARLEGYYDCVFLVMAKSISQMSLFMAPFMRRYGDYIQQKDLVTFITAHRFNQKFLFAGARREDWTYSPELGSYPLDAVDRKLLSALSNNARASLLDLAKKTGADTGTVQYRLQKLRRDKVILAFVTAPDFDKLCLQFIQINISMKDPTFSKQVISYFDSTNRCLYAGELLGKFDIMIEIHVENGAQLRQIIDSFREKFVGKYSDYDVSTVTHEYVVIWSPITAV